MPLWNNHSSVPGDVKGPESHFHLLIPATAANQDLCKLLFSVAVLQYPSPTLINWGFQEETDVLVKHLAKVQGLLRYLNTFPPQMDNDLVLIVDGYDTWFQLPPKILIQRYFEINAAADQDLLKVHGSNVTSAKDIRQTVLFGPDKLCWPVDKGRDRLPACRAVPPSHMPDYAFGPYLDFTFDQAFSNAEHARPRWLNSGTIIGPANDVRMVLEATAALIPETTKSGSDQQYFADLFGRQEHSRRLLNSSASSPIDDDYETPTFAMGEKTEFHVGLDYQSSLFQLAGHYAPYLSWMVYDGSVDQGPGSDHTTTRKPFRFEPPSDLISSHNPFAAGNQALPQVNISCGRAKPDTCNLPLDKTWRNVPLGTNVITKQVFALLHLTFLKEERDTWWNKMWYYSYSRALHSASVHTNDTPVSDSPIDGRIWWNSGDSHLANQTQIDKSASAKKDGAWTDKGEWISWGDLCQAHEVALFGYES